MKKYLLFDLDGTLTDPKVGITTCVQYALKSFGIEEPNLDKLEPFIGPPLKESFMNFYGLDDAQAEKAVVKYRERFQDIGIFENKIYDGIPKMLCMLKNKGMHLAVASSKPTVFVERILEHFQIEQYFEVVVGSELDGTRVNKEEVVQEALNRLFHQKPILREQIYMIGDRKFDVEGAKTHQVESVGVAYGYGSVKELKEANADYIVRSVEELQELLLYSIGETEGGPENGKTSRIQQLGTLVVPFLLFWFVRALTVNLLAGIAQGIGRFLPEDIRGLIFIRYEAETVMFTADALTVISAIGFVVAGFAIWTRAKKAIERTAKDRVFRQWKAEAKWKHALFAVVIYGATLGFNLLLSLTGMIANSSSYQEVASQQHTGNFLLGLICYAFISPVAEELLFRGILYGHLRSFVGIRKAILISAIIFGVYHMNAVQMLYGFLMGCLIAYGYEYFGDFRFVISMHMLTNLQAYVFTGNSILSERVLSWMICIVSLTVMAFCVQLLHRSKNIFKDR